MPGHKHVTTYRDPAHSLWQSAVHSTLMKRGQAEGSDQRGLGVTADHPFLAATKQAVHQIQHGTQAGPKTLHGLMAPEDVAKCAKLWARLAWAEMFDRGSVQTIKDEFTDSVCDPRWFECYAEYLRLKLTGGKQRYTRHQQMSDFVLDGCLPEKATVAIIADWGTGTNEALVLLQQIAANFKPDVLLHLGDVYYSGLASEYENHLAKPIREVWAEKRPLVFALSGNHDRYAGGKGYFDTIAKLNEGTAFVQPASYFALRNKHWQLLAMDTGLHDTNPWTETSNLTHIEETEAAWLLDKVEQRDGRGTVMFSHHQLMSFIGVGRDKQDKLLAVNPKLVDALRPAMENIDFWLWGHEHDLCLFEPYSADDGTRLPVCRCVGAGAIPVFPPEPEAQPHLQLPRGESQPPKRIRGTQLGDNGEVFNHAYAILTLDGPALTIDYYQLDSTGAQPGSPPPLTKVPHSDHAKR